MKKSIKGTSMSRYLLPLLLAVWQVNSSPQPNQVLAAYVLYGQNTAGEAQPMARVVLDDTHVSCPQLTATGQNSVPMTPRINPDPNNFPITVCEALYPFSQSMQVGTSGLKLPQIKQQIKTITVFGDTGCKASHQDCSLDSANWPFPALIKAAANHPPDVILHMGDYNYSGTPGNININGIGQVAVYDAGDNTTQGLCQIPGPYYGQNSSGSDFPDSWTHWQTDFFAAAQPMFAVAPWVFARGNHELCSRAGPGWFFLLDPNSSLLGQYQAQLSCPAATNPTPEVLTPPYLVSLKGLNLAVVDSANACDSGWLHADNYRNQFSIVKQLIHNNKNTTWVQTHRPLWGVDQLDNNGSCGIDSGKYCIINQTMQAAVAETSLPESVDLIMSGHMHRFQVLDFKATKHADQFVVGNSGVKLSGLHPKKTKTLTIDGQQATIMGIKQFGYMSFQLQGSKNWQGQLLNPTLAKPVLLSCDSQNKPICSMPKN